MGRHLRLLDPLDRLVDDIEPGGDLVHVIVVGVGERAVAVVGQLLFEIPRSVVEVLGCLELCLYPDEVVHPPAGLGILEEVLQGVQGPLEVR